MFTVKTKAKLVVARVKFVGFRLFLVSLGVVIGASGVFISYEVPKLLEPQIMTYNNVPMVRIVKAKEVEPADEWKTAEFSAYTASVGETDSNPLVMASGKMVYVGAIACPRSIELGTRVEVRGVGVFVCEDRMSARYNEHFDIFKLTKSEALQFGRKSLEYRLQ
jgi:3D (Asp-Asp-Asp) domain-containing protein